MIRTILVPTDFTIESEELLSCIGELKSSGLEKVILLHVVDIFKSQGLAPMFEENANKRIEEYRQLLEEMQVNASTIVVEGDVKKTIARIADEENVDCIVMGATTSGLIKGRLTGRTTEYIARKSGKIILIEKYDTLRETEEETYRKACSAKFSEIMLPVDFSENSKKILEEIRHLKDIIHEIVFVHVIESAKNNDELEDKKKESMSLLSEMGKEFEDEHEVKYIIGEGEASEVIDRLAEEMDITLIAMTTHGIGSFKDILLGSTAESLLRRTKKPILLAPADER
ncbi:universal stress protein [Methanolobus halotolerans]|uniref:Universal stress protein n=1 Tax=Methanolobus halotolerans TaxID=2052935 RepID=A0A4E0PX96_9EURY|nr:universal stress protein [Methanolobus halotolerans]TGC10661.1 universal stress protein [Methanolobus halotolerans]